MNRLDIRNSVLAKTRRTDKTSEINEEIDLGIIEIQQAHDFRLTRQTNQGLMLSEGDRTLDVSSLDIFQIISPITLIDPTNDLIVAQVIIKDRTWISRNYPDFETASYTGYPTVAFFEADVLTFVPGTQQDFLVRIDYYTLSALPSDAGDSTTIRRGIESALIARTTSKIFMMTQQFRESQFWMTEYGRCLAMAVRADQRDGEERVMQGFSQTRQMDNVPPWLDPFLGSGEVA